MVFLSCRCVLPCPVWHFVFTSTAFDERSFVEDRRVKVLQVTVQCALLNAPASWLTVLLFLARNCVTSGHDSRFCGTSRHVEHFFCQWWWQCVCQEVLLKVGFVKTYQSKMHQGCFHCQDSPHSSSPNTHGLKLERILTRIQGMIRNILHDQMCSNRRRLTR